jgi:hypothetical protein
MLMWGIELPPRGSARSWILEEMVHRQRMRQWHYHYTDVISVAAKVTGDKDLISTLAEHLDKLFHMELHAPESYDFIAKAAKVSDSHSPRTDEELLAMLDRIEDA